MLNTLALLAVLQAAPNAADGLTLANARITHGALGPTRKQAAFLPGDSLYLAFDVEGVTVDDAGKVLYSTQTDVSDSKGKVIFHQPHRDLEAIASLGGSRIPAFAQIDIGIEQPPGNYEVKVTVTDRATKKSQTVTQSFQVLEKAFGLVRASCTCDAEARTPVAAAYLIPGQTVWVNFHIVGFNRPSADRQPNVTLEMRVLDENGKPTVAKPFTGAINKDVPANAVSLPAQFHLALNRPGKFTVELKVTDQISGKTLNQAIPFTVHENK
jgi:hypothetical protein